MVELLGSTHGNDRDFGVGSCLPTCFVGMVFCRAKVLEWNIAVLVKIGARNVPNHPSRVVVSHMVSCAHGPLHHHSCFISLMTEVPKNYIRCCLRKGRNPLIRVVGYFKTNMPDIKFYNMRHWRKTPHRTHSLLASREQPLHFKKETPPQLFSGY